jgi:polysaccharide export outer membrane protein
MAGLDGIPIARTRCSVVGIGTGILLAWMASGCAFGRRATMPPAHQIQEFGEGIQQDPAARTPYRIQPGDTLDIKLPYHPEENARTVVRPDGRVMLTLTGDIVAAGLTTDELAAVITDRARDTLVDPVVSVTVQPGENLRVYVGGEVVNPGFVAFRPGLTAVQAIYDRGGPKPTANATRVALVSGVTAEGDYRLQEFDLSAALSGDHNAAPVLAPNDVLVVPTSIIGKMGQFVDLYINSLIPQFPRIPPVLF